MEIIVIVKGTTAYSDTDGSRQKCFSIQSFLVGSNPISRRGRQGIADEGGRGGQGTIPLNQLAKAKKHRKKIEKSNVIHLIPSLLQIQKR